MRTSKPVATISYNSAEFLKSKIEYLKEHGIIEYGMWIYHKKEADEKKDHWHVYLKPAKLIQTVDLENVFKELDPTWKPKEVYEDEKDKERHEKKQFLGVINFVVSKESDWLLYSLHDPNYQIEKGLSKQYVYGFDDIETTCEYTLQDIISRISDDRKGRIEYRLIECINMGMNWSQICSSGIIPLRNISGALIMYKAITGQHRDFI